MQDHEKPRRGYFSGLLPVLGLFAVYAYPIFATWGMHADYSMLVKAPERGWFGFVETEHLLAIGRPLNAVVSNVVFNTVHRVDDFAAWRLGGFVSMAVFLWGFGLYLRRRLGLEEGWVAATLFLTGLLPASTLFVVWTCVVPQGFFNVLLAFAAYLAAERGQQGDGRFRGDAAGLGWLALSSFLFMCALFLYPPTALAVFLFSWAHVILRPAGEWRQTRARVLSDVSLFGVGLLVYRLLERHIITPFLVSHQTYRPWQDYYNMGFMENVLAKKHVLLESTVVSFAGAGAFISNGWGLAMLGICLLAVAAVFRVNGRHPLEARERLERVAAGVALFALASLSVILPKNVMHLLGFRLVLVSSIMGVILLAGLLRSGVRNGLVGALLGRNIVIVYAACSALAVFMALGDVVRNYTAELRYVESKLAAAPFKTIARYAFIKLPEGEVLINRRLPYEYTYMITEVYHFLPFVIAASQKAGVSLINAEFSVMPADSEMSDLHSPAVFVLDPRGAAAARALTP